MPLTRYQTRNEYGLADPDLYQAADKDDPEALLEGVAMAGLVGILRQLGDLAEFAAEMFHDLHEEVMATASRSHGLMARVQQLESDIPFIEKTLLCQTDHSPLFSNKGVDSHPNLQLEQSVITRGDLPRCVMDSYEECRGPPRLFLLDKFDISGAGACLKRYTDPSFVRLETSSYETSWDDIQREKKSQKTKRRVSKNGGTPENALSSHAKLHELFLEEHLEARNSDPARAVKLKTRKLDGYSLISKSGESYMEKFLQTCDDNKTSYQIITPNPELLTWNMDSARDVVTDIPEISIVGSLEKSQKESIPEALLPNEQENVSNSNLNGSFIGKDIETVLESTPNGVPDTTVTKDSQTNFNGKPGFLLHRNYSEDLTSEADNYVDAPTTMESETDDECRCKNRSSALEDANHHRYCDVDKERMEDSSQFSFFHTPVSVNGKSSFGKQSNSYSCSDTASISIDDQSDGEKFSGCLPSSSSLKSELVDSTSQVATPETNKVSHDFNVQESVSNSNVDGQASFSLNDTCSSPRPISQNAESCSPEVVQNLSELVSLDQIKEGNDGSEVDPINSSRSSATSSISPTSESRFDNTIEKNDMVDDPSNLMNSGTSHQLFVDSQTGEELPVADSNIETNPTVAFSKGFSNSGSDPKSSDGSNLTGKLLPCSAEMEVSPDMPSKVCSASTVDEIHLKDTLNEETECTTMANAVADPDTQKSNADADSQSSVTEIANEHSCALGTTADVSVSESHEDTLENGMSMPAEVERELTSDFNSGGEELVGDASPACSKCDDHISGGGFHEHPGPENAATSDNHADTGDVNHAPFLTSTSLKGSLPWISTNTDGDFQDLPEPDNVTTYTVPEVELAMSDNHAETSSGDVNHEDCLTSTSLKGSLPWISTNTDGGFQDLPGADNATTCTVPKGELVMSDNHSDTSSGDVNHVDCLASTSSKGSLPWISNNTDQLSSEAREIYDDTVVEPDRTLPAENNPESEEKDQEIPLKVSSEGLSTALDSNDQASCKSLSPMASLDQSDGDTETKSSCKSILVDNFIDSTPVNNLNLLESVTIEQSKAQAPCVSHEFADEELLQSSDSRGSEIALESAGMELNSPKQDLSLDLTFPCFGFIPENTPPNQEDMPPLPPLPPMQWRIGKVSHSYFPNFMESVETSSSASTSAPSIGSSLNVQSGPKQPKQIVPLGSEKSEQLPGEFGNNASENPLPTIGTDMTSQYDSSSSQRTRPTNISAKIPTMRNQESTEEFGSEENNLFGEHASQTQELVYSQVSSLQLPQDPSAEYEAFKDDTDVPVSQSSQDHHHCLKTEAFVPNQSTKVEDKDQSVPDASNAEAAESLNMSIQKIVPVSVEDAMWPVNAFTIAPTLETNKPEEVPMVRLPRPKSPLVDAVAAHDRRTMKKVSERVQPPMKPKQDDKDSLLEQIRNKSINLKPAAVATRPNIQTGPKTNLRVAAILEKANTIRQAMVGSDEDEDSDSWSDS